MKEQNNTGSDNIKNNGSTELPPGELSPNFKFKVIMGIIFLFFTIYFIYTLIRMVVP